MSPSLPTKSGLALLAALSVPCLLACEDDTPAAGGEVEDASRYLNGRDRNTVELPDFEPTATGDAAVPEPPDGLVFIDGSTVPTSDAAPEADADESPPPREDARLAPPEDAAVAPPDPDAEVPPPPDDDCAAALRAATFDFENGPAGFTHQPSDGADLPDWPLDPWEHGRAASGPGACVDAGACWGTDLDDNLTQCQRAELISPSIDLTACAGRSVELVFDHWYDFWSGTDGFENYYDGGLVEVSTDGRRFELLGGDRDYPGVLNINPSLGFGYECYDPDGFHVDDLPGFVDQSRGWEEAHLPLGENPGRFVLRWAFATGVSVETTDPYESQLYEPPGWYVDRIRFEAR